MHSNGTRLNHHHPNGDRSTPDHTDGVGTKKPRHHETGTWQRRRYGKTHGTFQRMVATRKRFTSRSIRVARDRDMFLRESLSCIEAREKCKKMGKNGIIDIFKTATIYLAIKGDL